MGGSVSLLPLRKKMAGFPIRCLPEQYIVLAGGRRGCGSGPAQDRGDSAPSTQIAMQSLWNIKVAVLVKPEHENRISHVSTSSVKTGIANTLGEQSGRGPSVHTSCFLSSPGSPPFGWSRLFRI